MKLRHSLKPVYIYYSSSWSCFNIHITRNPRALLDSRKKNGEKSETLIWTIAAKKKNSRETSKKEVGNELKRSFPKRSAILLIGTWLLHPLEDEGDGQQNFSFLSVLVFGHFPTYLPKVLFKLGFYGRI